MESSAVVLARERRCTFPSAATVTQAGAEPLARLELGLHNDKAILAAAERVRDGKLDLEHLAKPEASCASAMYQLMGCHGVGPKIAACSALFSLGKTDAFPVDVHVRNAPSKCRGSQVAEDAAAAWGAKLGEHSGYLSQFLFRADLDAARAAGRRTFSYAGSGTEWATVFQFSVRFLIPRIVMTTCPAACVGPNNMTR